MPNPAHTDQSAHVVDETVEAVGAPTTSAHVGPRLPSFLSIGDRVPEPSEPANRPMDPATAALAVLVEMRDLLARQARPVPPHGPCTLLTVAEAIAELGMSDTEGRAFLTQHKLVHHVGRPRRGSGRVIMGDLLEAVRGNAVEPMRKAPTTLPLPKTKRF